MVDQPKYSKDADWGYYQSKITCLAINCSVLNDLKIKLLENN